ncbi:MAG: fluoride efflux transporter CrcB [Acidobacteriota bacterium]
MIKLLLVLLGGAVGTGFRYGAANLAVYATGQIPKYPYATFFVNITGSLLIGFLAELFDARMPVSPELRAALLVGVLGGYTTFSSLSFETLSLMRDGKLGIAMLYSLGSLALGLTATWTGVRLAQMI